MDLFQSIATAGKIADGVTKALGGSSGTSGPPKAEVIDYRLQMDPVGNYNFILDGISTGIFQGIENITQEVEMIEYRVADNPNEVRFRPGMPKATRITLKRGFITHFDLNHWIQEVGNGNYLRRDAEIVVYDNANEDGGKTEAARWKLYGCMPTKWSLSSLDGKASDNSVETIELVVEKLERTAGTSSRTIQGDTTDPKSWRTTERVDIYEGARADAQAAAAKRDEINKMMGMRTMAANAAMSAITAAKTAASKGNVVDAALSLAGSGMTASKHHVGATKAVTDAVKGSK